MPKQVFLAGSGFAANASVEANGQAVSVLTESSTSITVFLPAAFFAKAGSVSLVVTDPGSPAVQSNSGTLSVVASTAGFSITPNAAPAGSPDTTITVRGNGFFADSTVQWNGTALATKFVDAGTLNAVIPGSCRQTSRFRRRKPQGQHPAAAFQHFLALATNDLVWNPKDGLIYASTPGSAGPNLGNSIVSINPHTGVIQRTISSAASRTASPSPTTAPPCSPG